MLISRIRERRTSYLVIILFDEVDSICDSRIFQSNLRQALIGLVPIHSREEEVELTF